MKADERAQRAALVGAVLVAAAAWMSTPPNLDNAPHPADPAPSTRLPGLPSDFEVLDSEVSPSRTRKAFAAFRDRGMPGVFLREKDSAEVETLWSVPRPTESAGDDLPWAVAVAWAPDESQLAFLTLRHRGPTDRQPRRSDVAVYTVALDGSDTRMVSDDLGACYCLSTSANLTWSTQLGLRVGVPNGTQGEIFTLDPEP